jgi:hypothetical protein
VCSCLSAGLWQEVLHSYSSVGSMAGSIVFMSLCWYMAGSIVFLSICLYMAGNNVFALGMAGSIVFICWYMAGSIVFMSICWYVYGREEVAKAKLPQRRGNGMEGSVGGWMGEGGGFSERGVRLELHSPPPPPADLPSCLLGL